uniref:ABC transporter ATP-binding protein n=1 Tax=Pararhizobium sp. IMCC3301 TaxID=3067904 RepID=UPI00274288E9|nr:sn-glycerol-3-phosphate ABC transporter ATP-binding protein UgpC [Pararhizobium sp. IMCC3301]
MSELHIRDGFKSYGEVSVLRNINLDVATGEFVVLVGPSGCGKSTLLRMISGLEDITSGEMELDGCIVNDVDPAQRGIAMVFQSYALFPHMTVAQNMGFSLKLAKRPRSEIAEKVGKAAAILRLEELLDRKPSQLSGGQKQRVAIGRAIVRDPKIFLFDEPLSNLDAELRIQMRAELIQLHEQLGTTMIYVTHDQVEAMTLADKMVVLEAGNIQQVGRPLELYDDPDNKFVAGFVGTPKMNFMAVKVVKKTAGALTLALKEGADGYTFTVPFRGGANEIGDELEVGIRPDQLHFQEKAGNEFTIPVSVAFVEELGDLTYVYVDTATEERLSLQKKDGRHNKAREGFAVAEATSILLFDLNGKRMRAA